MGPGEVRLDLSEGMQAMSDGFAVYCRRWTPRHGRKGTLCVLHGLGEHCGRYGHIAEQFAAAGYATRAFDLRGFGRSQGRRGHMRFARTLQDLDALDDLNELVHVSRDTFRLSWPALDAGSQQITFTVGPDGQASQIDTETLGRFTRLAPAP